MEAHYWLFPWLSLLASLIAAIGALFLCRPDPSKQNPPPILPSAIIVWVAATALMVFGGLKLGDWSSVDYIPARGILGGAIGGLILTLCLRRQAKSVVAETAALFGFATALVASFRLWLTHGELSGLTAAALSSGITLLCLSAGQGAEETEPRLLRSCLTITAYSISLTGAVLLGFTRAYRLGDAFWADIPLMLGGALSLGLLVAAALERFGAAIRLAAMLAIAGAVLAPLGIVVAHSLPMIGVTALGVIAVAIPLALMRRTARKELPSFLGFLLMIAAITVAFTLLSGYGLALFAFGVIFIAAFAMSTNIDMPPGWIAFSALLVIYRLEILQNVSATRSIGPGNIWDLLAIGLGVLLPQAVASWLTDYAPKARWTTTFLWFAAVSAPTLTLDYIWAPRTLTGLFLGLAVGQLIASSPGNEVKAKVSAFSSLLISLLLFLFLPGIDVLTAPNRTDRIICVTVLALALIVRIVTDRSQPCVPAKAA